MALLGWTLAWEMALAYIVAPLESPVDAALLAVLLAVGMAAGYYGLRGRYWQTIAWLFGLTWYVAGLGRYIAAVDPLLATAPAPLPLFISLLYTIALPIGWLAMPMLGQSAHWLRRWRMME